MGMGWAWEEHNLESIRQVKQYGSKLFSVLRSRDLSCIEANSLWAFYLAADVWLRATDGYGFGYCRLFQMEGARVPHFVLRLFHYSTHSCLHATEWLCELRRTFRALYHHS